MTGDAPVPEYPSAAVGLAHPARLRAWASMHGVGAWSGDRFRYLEIGCGNAASLLPLAAQFPLADFVGVDRDADVVARGRRVAEACGLSNVQLVEADIRDYVADEGQFDYVVSHGVFSWVPPDAQERILAVAAQALSPLGVAYLSYNTFPGWGLRGVIRDVMLDAAGLGRGHAGLAGVAGLDGRAAGLRAAKGRVAELKRRMVRPDHPYSQLLASELELALDKDDGYLLREHLAEVNEPMHVKDFLRRASAHGLSYVCELLPATPEGDVDLELVADLVGSGMSRADAEQCLDVLTFRQFRATLLCRGGVPLAPEPSFASLSRTGFFSAWLVPVAEEPLLGPGKVLAFRAQRGVLIESTRPLLKAALLVLSRIWPVALSPQRLIAAALASLRERGLLGAAGVDEAEIRGALDDLVQLCRRRIVELLPWAPPIRADIPSRPAVRPLTRHEAERSRVVTAPSHEPISLDEPVRAVVRLLDGTRDVRGLITELSNLIDCGELALVTDLAGADRAARLAQIVSQAVARVRALGLLDPDAEPRGAVPALSGSLPAPSLPGGPP